MAITVAVVHASRGGAGPAPASPNSSPSAAIRFGSVSQPRGPALSILLSLHVAPSVMSPRGTLRTTEYECFQFYWIVPNGSPEGCNCLHSPQQRALPCLRAVIHPTGVTERPPGVDQAQGLGTQPQASELRWTAALGKHRRSGAARHHGTRSGGLGGVA